MATLILNGERIEVEVGETIFAAADRSRRGRHVIPSSCARVGLCRECIVEVRRGNGALTPLSEHESFLLKPGELEERVFRLACQAAVVDASAVIEVEAFKQRLRIATTGQPAAHRHDPWVRREDGSIDADGESIPDPGGPLLGLAMDVGTTTIVMDVLDLTTGQSVAQRAYENPQQFGGSDVMHRITYEARHPGQLHRTIIAHLNGVLRGLPVDAGHIVAVTVAANPTMRDLFFGLDVSSLGHRPYVSTTQVAFEQGDRPTTAIRASGEGLGLAVHPRAVVYGLPIIASHVGADMAAVLGTLGADRIDRPFMVVDIGTNTEVVVGDGHRLLCASCPAGPAFEGGRLSCGMPAADGAITALRRRDGTWETDQIGDGIARGICGSGWVDLLAELRTSGEMDALGRFDGRATRIPVCEEAGLFFTRSDASELAQAKSANGVGQAVLLRRLGLTVERIDRYYLAGAFASNLDLDHARQIGLALPVADDRIIRLGNASIEGAKAVLLDRGFRDRVESLVRRIEHVELEIDPAFFELYVDMTQIAPISLAD